MKKYDHKKLEKKWQKIWEKKGLYRTKINTRKQKYYVLDMFPYPSGEGLHVGHPKGYIGSDVHSRFKRMQGYDVLHPMGWDAFGLPAENYALKNKIHPRTAVEKNITRFKKQLGTLGFDYDWDREINTTDPEYYKWTQWIFLKLFERGLAYHSKEPINWCPSCKTGLANEDLEGDKCERCGSVVLQKSIPQWVLKIREYADRLLSDLDGLEWPESVKEAQRNWIGRSEGVEISFKIQDSRHEIQVFTTRPDTLFGVTFLVLSPEHPLISKFKSKISNWDNLEKYVDEAKNKTEQECTDAGKEKTGIELMGTKAINPANGEEIPVWVADYVFMGYGTGAIMAVPAHDERDYDFANKYGLPIRQVVEPVYTQSTDPGVVYMGKGMLVNSGQFNEIDSNEAKTKITEFVKGKKRVTYRLRDWVFSRQRYWGEPIPLVFCEHCAKRIKNKEPGIVDGLNKGELLNPGWAAVSEETLPVTLPEVERYEPTGTGESPLANIREWVNVMCPKCGGSARRETNTMPQWAGSSWYYIAYCISENLKSHTLISKQIKDAKIQNKIKYWLPVDMYVGGVEHATRHLVYVRFWHKFLYDIEVLQCKEPFYALKNQGLIYGKDGRKMSKRWGNAINPDSVVDAYGADTLRVHEMFMGPFEDTIAWNTENIIGSRRFLEKVWRLQTKLVVSNDKHKDIKIEKLLHRTVKKVTEDIERFRFNTAISQMMIFINSLESLDKISLVCYSTFLRMLAPFAPHCTEELWEIINSNASSIHLEPWPTYNETLLQKEDANVVIQINSKIRGIIKVRTDEDESNVVKQALKEERISKWVKESSIKRVIYIKNKLLNLIT